MQDMNVTIMINEDGQVCVVHDAPLKGTPVCVTHAAKDNILRVEFDDSTREDLGNDLDPEIAKRLEMSAYILLVRLENGQPVEGFEVPFYQND